LVSLNIVVEIKLIYNLFLNNMKKKTVSSNKAS